MTPRRRTRRRWLGVVLLVVLLEGSLQLASPLVQRALSRSDTAAPGARLTVLCVGDSNTYGLHVPRVWTYPAQLQGQLQLRYESAVSVVNRGVPGQNSAQVAGSLADDLHATDADLTLVLVGINDTWNTAAEGAGPLSWLGRLKLARLVRVLAAGVTTAEPFQVATDDQGEFIVRRGDTEQRVNAGDTAGGTATDGAGLVRSGEALAARLAASLDRMEAACADAGSHLVLLTYPEAQGLHGEVNAILREQARQRELDLVDLESRFADHYAREGYGSLMFNDKHPNIRGYGLVAEEVVAALAEAGLVSVTATGADVPGDDVGVDVPPTLTAAPDGRLELAGPPGWAFQVLVAGPAPAGRGLPLGDVELPLAEDATLAASRQLPTLSGWLDDEGHARIRLPRMLLDTAGHGPLHACLLLLHAPGSPASMPLAAVSKPVVVDFSAVETPDP